MSTEVKVIELPDCDMCAQRKHKRPAAYDGKTIYGPWANMCEDDFQAFGIGLGTGRGQRLILSEG